MRPVNLIPPEERRGVSAPTRTGALSYVLVGVLALVLLAVSVAVVFDKRVSDREAEVATLEDRAAEAQATAASLASFTSFQQVRDARAATIDSLAKSRFDWERVMRELAIVLPRNVWLTNVTGTVTPEVQVESAAGVALRSTVEGPALELIGCARSQPGVARLIAAVEDIDGVTRVTVSNSEEPDSAASADSGGGGGGSTSDECRTRDTISKFQLVAAFDAVPVPEGATAPPVTPPDTTTPTATDGGVADAQGRDRAERRNVNESSQRTDNATELIPGG